MAYKEAAGSKCILAMNHSVLYKPTEGFWNLPIPISCDTVLFILNEFVDDEKYININCLSNFIFHFSV